MSYYTKARLWSNIASNINSISQATGDIVQMSRNIADMDTNRLLNDNFDDYKKIVDYTDSHIISAQNSDRESFIAAAASATGVDSKFIDKVFTTTNFDPAKMNGATLTDWMLQNGYGTESWRRDYVTKKLVESEENNIAEYIQTSLINDANEQLESNPSSLDNWSSFTGKKLNEYMNAEKIANALNMNVQRVNELMTSGNISERVNKWYETDFSDEMNKLKYQQQQAKLRQNVSANLKAMSLQAVTEGWDSKSYVDNVNKLIDSSGVNLITDSNERDRIAYDAFNEYVTQSTIEWSKNHVYLSRNDFIDQCMEFSSSLRKDIDTKYTESGEGRKLPSSFTEGANTDYTNAYSTKLSEQEDPMAVKARNLVMKLAINPELALSLDTEEKIATELGMSNLDEIYSSKDKMTYFNAVFSARNSALDYISAQENELANTAKSSASADRQQFYNGFAINLASIKERAKNGEYFTADQIAFEGSGGKFKTMDEAIDNGGSQLVAILLNNLDEIYKESAKANGFDAQQVMDSARQRRDSLGSTTVDTALVRFTDSSVSVEIGERSSVNDTAYETFAFDQNTELDYTFNKASISFTGDKSTVIDWAVYEDDLKAGMMVYDYSGFSEFVKNNVKNEDLKNDPYFMKNLIIQWNSSMLAYDEAQQIQFEKDFVIKESYSLSMQGKHDSAKELMNENKLLFADDPEEWNKAMTTIEKVMSKDEDVSMVTSMIRSIIDDELSMADGSDYKAIMPLVSDREILELAERYAGYYQQGMKNDEIMTQLRDVIGQKKYDSDMKKLQSFFKNNNLTYTDIIENEGFQNKRYTFEETYRMMSEGTMPTATGTDISQYNAWLINDLAGKETKLDTIYDYLWTSRTKSGDTVPDKITIGGTTVKQKDKNENNYIYAEAVMLKGSIERASEKAKYLSNVMKESGVKENDMNYVNFSIKTENSDMYDIALYDTYSGSVYFMPGDSSSDIYMYYVDESLKEIIDKSVSSGKMITINNSMLQNQPTIKIPVKINNQETKKKVGLLESISVLLNNIGAQ